MVTKSAQDFKFFLNNPIKVLLACLIVFSASVVLNGTLWKVWGLYRDHDRLQQDIAQIAIENVKTDEKIRLAKDPSYIERQARDKMDLVSENDLIFVFPD